MSHDPRVVELVERMVGALANSLSRQETRALNELNYRDDELSWFYAATYSLAMEIIARRRRRKPPSAQWISRTKH
jgi:hypothetical protein